MEILKRLPDDDAAIERMLASGYDLAEHMGWDAMAREYVSALFAKMPPLGAMPALNP